jgi:drug/metabolite transporter (DMT)-like permease
MDNTENSRLPVNIAPIVAAVLALLIWSGTAIANKIAVGYIDALSIGVLRSMIAGMLAAIFAFVLRLPFPSSRRDLVILLIAGTTSFAIWPALLSVGIELTTASHAALIMALIPIFTILIAAVIDGGKPRLGWWTGSAIAVGGAAVIVIARVGPLKNVSDGASMAGDLIILLGCVTCSLGYVAGGKLSRRLGTVATTFWGLATTLVILLPLFLTLSHLTAWGNVPLEGWLAVAWLTFLSSFAGYVLWFYALGHGGIGRIGTLQLTMPMTTLVLAVLILGEKLTLILLVSCAVIITGTYLAHRYAR